MKIFFQKIITSLLLGIYFFVTNHTIYAQQQEAVIINTDLVTTWAQVTRRTDGLPVKGLSLDDFQLREDGKLQQLHIIKDEQPLSVLLLVDGYRDEWPAEKWYQRIPEMLRELGKDSEIGIIGFDSTTVLVQPLTNNIKVLTDKLKDKVAFFYFLGKHLPERIAESRPGEGVLPRIGDATYTAVQYLERAASPIRRKIIIFITWRSFWMDETTIHTRAEVEAFLEQTDTTVYALLHGNEVRVHDNDLLWKWTYRGRVKKSLRGGTIERFIKSTGGASLIGRWEDCDAMFMKLARQIRSTYTIGYYPENTNFDGKFRRIKLELSPSGKAKAGNVNIAVREGYHAVRRSPTKAAEANPKQ